MLDYRNNYDRLHVINLTTIIIFILLSKRPISSQGQRYNKWSKVLTFITNKLNEFGKEVNDMKLPMRLGGLECQDYKMSITCRQKDRIM